MNGTLQSHVRAMEDECDRYRKALERLAQAMPLVNPREHLGAELHARIMFAREALKGDE